MEDRKFPIEVGQEVFLQPSGNLARRNINRLDRGVITKIARKYFYVDRGGRGLEKFEIESFKNINADCNAAWILWPTEAAYNRSVELQQKLDHIWKFFRYRYHAGAVTPEVIDQVYDLIKTEETK